MNAPRTIAATTLLLTGALISSACDGDQKASAAHAASLASPASRSASSSAAPPSGPAPSASSLWTDATRSLAKRRTVHFRDWFAGDDGNATGTNPTNAIEQEFDVSLDGRRMHGTQAQEPSVPTIEMLTLDGHTFEKYTERMLRTLAGKDEAAQDALVKRVGGRWVAMGTAKAGEGPVRAVSPLTEPTHPAAKGFAAPGATVTPSTFAGRSAWELRSADGHQRAWIAADASHDLLRLESTRTTARDASETLELSRFDVPFTVSMPRDTVSHSVIEDAMNADFTRH